MVKYTFNNVVDHTGSIGRRVDVIDAFDEYAIEIPR